MGIRILDTRTKKICIGEDYNFEFNKVTGRFDRWGKTYDDDPVLAPHGPEIADIEISTVCHGVAGVGPCKFCYKCNSAVGENMSFEVFKTVFSKLPRTLTQIAFGIGDLDANPDLWKILQHCRDNGVVPNITINGDRLNDDLADRLIRLCGAVAVSRYAPRQDICYDAVQRLSQGLSQVNIHMMLSTETYDECLTLLREAKTDPRLEKLNAVVFLDRKVLKQELDRKIDAVCAIRRETNTVRAGRGGRSIISGTA